MPMKNDPESAFRRAITLTLLLIVSSGVATAQKQSKAKGILLESLSWVEAEKVLKPETVVVVALGARAKEHGPHLPLNADWLQAEYYKSQVLQASNVVVAPTIAYGFYPAFLEYPGSTSLKLDTSRDLIADVCRSLARYGPSRFYLINIGISTNFALKPAAEMLESEGILLHFLDLTKRGAIESSITTQVRGSHADEVETSLMLYISPNVVNMRLAVKDMNERRSGMLLTRDPKSVKGVYSPSGIWGDPTLATREKGKQIAEERTSQILSEIEALRLTPVPKTTEVRK